MSTELSNGVIIPEEYSDDWYDEMSINLRKLNDVITAASDNATDIQRLDTAKANQTDLTALGGRVTQNETDITALQTAVSGKADDNTVVHTSGNETVGGQKTFTNTIKSKKEIEFTGNRLAYILPEFSASYSGLSLCTYDSNGAVKIGSWKVDDNDNTKHVLDASLGFLNVTTGSSNSVNIVYLTPKNSTNSKLGDSTNKWNEINGLTPSSMSMPNFSGMVDITSYVSDLTGVANEYTPTVNGWICIRSANANKISILDSGTNIGNTSISNTATYLTLMTPCVANRKVFINIICTSLDFAYFIPCLGNI